MNIMQKRERLAELVEESKRRLKAAERGDITTKSLNGWLDRAEHERNGLVSDIKAYENALRYSGGAAEPTNEMRAKSACDPAAPVPQGDTSRLAKRKHKMASPFDMTGEQLKSLFIAGRDRLPSYSVRIGDATTKSIGEASLVTKDALIEGTPGSLLPPSLLPNTFPLRQEPTRIAEFLLGAQATGQELAYIQHTGNSNGAETVAESAEKPDIGIQLSQKTTHFTVIAGLATVSRQLFDDFADVAAYLPRAVSQAVILEESKQILAGDGSGSNLTGLLNTSGTLTRSRKSGETKIDVLVKAFNDLRTGSEYATADLVTLHPDDWNDIELLKNDDGRYVLNPNDPNALAGIDNLFGRRVITTTGCTKGNAVVLDSTIAATVYVRTGLEVLFNQYGDQEFRHNELTYRGEERIGLAVQRPHAVNLVTLTAKSGS